MPDSQRRYARPLPCSAALPAGWPLGSGHAAFREIAVMARGEADEVLPAEAVSTVHPALRDTMARLMAGDRALRRGPEIMAIVNVTPDSFSDGGTHAAPDRAAAFARKAIRHGATIIDIGGESTRPGAEPVTPAAEIARVVPALHAIRAMMVAEGVAATLSIDTRNAPVAAAALDAGATLLNDVSALTHDPAMAEVAPRFDQVCLMHAQGDPQTMQRDPRYADVVLDVYDYLEQRIAAAEALGIARHRLIADPGIGFGKTIDHNLALLDALSLFHGLGTRLLLGASRKRFIGTLAEGTDTGHSADDRAAGSVSAALWGVAQGVQVMRVHDTAETAQALAVWTALATVAPRAASAATAPAATEGHAAAVAVTTDEGALR